MVESLKDKACIVGIGETEYSKNSGRSEMRLALEAISAACEDAGISPKELGGIVNFSMDNCRPDEIARNFGIENISWLPIVHGGGGAGCATVQMAAMGVALGKAKYVAAFRSLNERSGVRYGTFGLTQQIGTSQFQYSMPFGLLNFGAMISVIARRHMHLYGTKESAFGEVAVAFRKHANMTPGSMMHAKTMTMEDYFNSRMMADPLRMFDFCLEMDGAAAVILTSPERAKDLKQKPAHIMAAAQGTGSWCDTFAPFQRDNYTVMDEQVKIAKDLWEEAGIGPQDIDCAQIYDAFTPLVLTQLEAFGLCDIGESGDFVSGGNLQIGGKLPTNTSGGQLSGGYLHGMNLVVEGVRQIRGASHVQVPDCKHVLVTSVPLTPSSALVLH